MGSDNQGCGSLVVLAPLTFMGEPNIKVTTMPTFIDKTNRPYTRLNEREADKKVAYKATKSSNADVRYSAKKALHNMNNESGAIKSMRQALIKAHRQGRTEEIKDIHDYIRNKSRYHNE